MPIHVRPGSPRAATAAHSDRGAPARAPIAGAARPPRRPRPAWALLLALAPCLLLAAAAQAAPPVGLSLDLSLSHDGETRSYDVLRPLGSVGKAAPLVVDLHGAGSNGDQQRLISGWQAIAESDGLVVVWPDGIANVWNGGTCCGSAVTNDVDDVGFILAVVAQIMAEVNIDGGRVYVTGLSNGGAMTQRLVCEAAGTFAAAAPMAFPVPYTNFALDCNPSESVPVLSFMGLTDTLVPYSGAAPSFAGWREKNGCDAAGAAPEITEVHGGGSCSIDTSCSEAGVEVGLCSVNGSTFDPPGDVYDGHILYINEDGLDLSLRAWDFMKVHRTAAPVPTVSAPWLLYSALGGVATLALARRRRP